MEGGEGPGWPGKWDRRAGMVSVYVCLIIMQGKGGFWTEMPSPTSGAPWAVVRCPVTLLPHHYAHNRHSGQL